MLDRYPLPSEYLPQVFLSRDGKTAFVQDLKGVALRDTATGKEQHRLPLGERQTGRGRFRRTAASLRRRTNCRNLHPLWNVADGKERVLAEFMPMTLAFSPCNHRCAETRSHAPMLGRRQREGIAAREGDASYLAFSRTVIYSFPRNMPAALRSSFGTRQQENRRTTESRLKFAKSTPSRLGRT